MGGWKWWAAGMLLVSAPGSGPVLRLDFGGAEALRGVRIAGGGTVAVVDGALRVSQADTGATSAILELPIDRVRGQRLAWTVRVKAEDVSQPPESWNGVKTMAIVYRGEQRNHPAPQLSPGTYDWRQVRYMTRIPEDATRVELVLGLQASSGTVWFDDLEITVGRPRWAVSAGFERPAEVFRGHDLPRGRGFMVGPRFREEDWRDLGESWNVNLVRWQMNWAPMKEAETWAADVDRFRAWLDEELAETDQALAAAEKYGILVLVDLHTPPGGRRQGGHCRLFDEQRYQDLFLESWDKIARRYAGRKVIWAYDLVNEPVQTTLAEGLLDWRTLAEKATDVIRAIDPGKPILVEPTPWGGPEGFDSFAPLARPDIIYSCHFYQPHRFTHQTLHDNPGGLVYPGEIGGEQWDQARIRQALEPAVQFTRDFNVAMMIGEFSAIRWAPDNSADRYIRDCVEVFEELGWDWTYHAFREFEGWSAELGTVREDRTKPAEPPVRERLLRDWFGRNVKTKLLGAPQ